jgi:hypothetical protein
MYFSTLVNYSRRYGKSIGNTINNTQYINNDNNIDNNNDIYVIIKNDYYLCKWLYYEDIDKFIKEFRLYLKDNNINYNNTILIDYLLEIFWLESNDPTLNTEYTQKEALDNYKIHVESNDYNFKNELNDDTFKYMLRSMNYRNKNKKLTELYIKLFTELDYARFDDILQTRTKEEWEIIYSLRYMYKNIVNNILSITDVFNFTFYELNTTKKKLEYLLKIYQTTNEGYNWYYPYSKQLIDSIEYFPRDTSKPSHDYAYSSYYNFDINNIQQKIDKMN